MHSDPVRLRSLSGLRSLLADKLHVVGRQREPKPDRAEGLLFEINAVSIPTMSPEQSSSGPPELPGLIDASVWMKSSNGVRMRSRFNALTTPVLTEVPIPKGLPTAITGWPTCRASLSPNCNAGSLRGKVHLEQGEVHRSAAAINCAGASTLSWKMTRIIAASWMTCLLVTMIPDGSITAPEPTNTAICSLEASPGVVSLHGGP